MAAALKQVGKRAALGISQQLISPHLEKVPTLVFLGPPGVGKGTYSTRIAERLGFAHISVGDLLRNEIRAQTEPGRLAAAAVARGDLLSDELIFDLLESRMLRGQDELGEEAFLLDGFPRTAAQAELLVESTDVKIAVNMTLREDVLLAKCLGRRICTDCGKNYNIADIDYPATEKDPAVFMPPLHAPESCLDKLVSRPDDTADVFRHRMEVYRREAEPVENVFRKAGLLLDFPVFGGIPEVLPRLVQKLEPFSFASSGLQPRFRHAAAATMAH